MTLLCGCYEISYPSEGYQVVENILEAPIVAGTGSKSNFLLAGFPWEVANQVDKARFVFFERLPFSVWECKGIGCATRLQVITDNGAVIPHSRRIGQDMHVCTADYVQTVGRVHCGERRAGGELLDRPRTSYIGDASDVVWEADYFSRLISGRHSWTQTTAPWQPAEDGVGAEWSETPWTGQPLERSLQSAHNLDLGACSVFVPWKWEDRDPRLDPMLGPMLGDRGLAELTLDELDSAREASASTNEMQDVAWFFDAFTNLWPREIPSEFHYQVTGTGARQVCLRSYFSTNTKLRTRPSGPNIIAESIVAGFTALFGIGDCKTHPMSVRFCGELGTVAGAPRFTLDDSSVRVEMEPYSRFKPSCNNKFVPLVKEGLADGVEKLTDAVMTEKLAALTSGLPFEIRRIELSPSGAYLVVAEDYHDTQYAAMKLAGVALARDRGVLCRPELGDSDFEHLPIAPYDFTVPKRGITR
ncbi:MAG TPA: hypothetical protein VFG22_13425 [Polyangiales bacterium]|nr:hypothetical protein [Polyangiales bacterium]